jgi:hypothetical protein
MHTPKSTDHHCVIARGRGTKKARYRAIAATGSVQGAFMYQGAPWAMWGRLPSSLICFSSDRGRTVNVPTPDRRVARGCLAQTLRRRRSLRPRSRRWGGEVGGVSSGGSRAVNTAVGDGVAPPSGGDREENPHPTQIAERFSDVPLTSYPPHLLHHLSMSPSPLCDAFTFAPPGQLAEALDRSILGVKTR